MGTALKTDSIDSREALHRAADAGVPLTVVRRTHNQWTVYQARFAIREEYLRLEIPLDLSDMPQQYPASDDVVGISFRLGIFRFSFSATVEATKQIEGAGGNPIFAAAVAVPETLNRTSRRVHKRICPPSGLTMRVIAWPGSAAAEPEGEDPACPAWRGNVIDFSSAGMRMRLARSAAEVLQVGDRIGLRVELRPETFHILVSSQVVHTEIDSPGMSLVGVRFIAPAPSEDEQLSLDNLAHLYDAFAHSGS
ncbi:MAG: PilZ domain-containing protein [Phycisphaerae bacterium]